MTMTLTQVTTGGVDENINIDSNTLKVDSTNNRVGIGTASPAANLHVVGSSGLGAIQIGNGASDAQYHYINFGGNSNSHNAWQIGRSPSGGVGPANGFYIYDLKNSQTRLAIDSSGNVGVGATPNSFSNYTTVTIGGASTGSGIDLERSDGNIYGRVFADAAGLQIQAAQSGDAIRFETSGDTERMRIDSSGQLLIGKTSGSYPLEVGGVSNPNIRCDGGSSSGQRGLIFAYNGTNFGSVGQNPQSGELTIRSGESGQTGYYITLETGATERMRVDQNGVVGINKSTGHTTGGFASPQLSIKQSATDWTGGIHLESQGSSKLGCIANTEDGLQISQSYRTSNDGGAYKPIIFRTSGNERVRIDNSGKVAIGTSVTTADLNVYGPASGVLIQNSNTGTGANNGLLFGSWGGSTGYVWNYENDNIHFGTNNVERMRLTSDGRLNVGHQAGATNTKAYFNSSGISQTMYVQATGSGSTYGIYSYVYGGNSTQYALYGQVNTQSTQSSGGILGYSINSNTYGIIGYWSGSSYYTLYGNGVVAGSSFTSVSDSRLKDVDSNLTGCLSKLANIQPVKYTWKENSQQRRSVGEGVEIGMLAQEVQAQFPELVNSVNNGRVNGSNPETLNEQIGTTLHIDYSRMTAVLVQALKEAKERIETLETKVAALEAAE